LIQIYVYICINNKYEYLINLVEVTGIEEIAISTISIAELQYGIIRSELQFEGKIIGNIDMLIGAQAKSNDLILVTNNVKEFKRIKGIKIEKWVR